MSTAFAQVLQQLRSRADRDTFRDLVERRARADRAGLIRDCLPTLAPVDLQILAALPESVLRIRPCFGHAGTVLSIRDEDAIEPLSLIGPELGQGIVRLVVSPGIGREELPTLLELLPLDGLQALRVDGNDIRCRKAWIRYGDDNVIHLRVDGDDRVLMRITSLPQLRDLRLCDNRLGPEGARVLATMPGLDKLDLRNNGLGDAGALALAALPVRELRLEANEIGPSGAEALATQQAIIGLDLSRNPISDNGATALAQRPFDWLRLAGCGIRSRGAHALLDLPTTTRLDLRDNAFGVRARKRLLKRFPRIRV